MWCIVRGTVGRFEVSESSGARSRSCSIPGQKQHSWAKSVSFFKKINGEKNGLITNCLQTSFKTQKGFYWKSEALISCLPIRGHGHKQGRMLFLVSLQLKLCSLVYPLLFCIIICVKESHHQTNV